MNEVAIDIILTYIDQSLFEPDHKWPDHIFEYRTYSRWAAYEVLERIMDHPHDDPIMVFDRFWFEICSILNGDLDPKKKKIFSIAKQTIEEITLLFV